MCCPPTQRQISSKNGPRQADYCKRSKCSKSNYNVMSIIRLVQAHFTWNLCECFVSCENHWLNMARSRWHCYKTNICPRMQEHFIQRKFPAVFHQLLMEFHLSLDCLLTAFCNWAFLWLKLNYEISWEQMIINIFWHCEECLPYICFRNTWSINRIKKHWKSWKKKNMKRNLCVFFATKCWNCVLFDKLQTLLPFFLPLEILKFF